ncbi:MAG: glycoside hydrolase family 127 protein [Clostridia bacterium]|nr:glycoside hydrolase family 127 protein [Clostridia bacterium]
MEQGRYEHFDPLGSAYLVRRYIMNMVDENRDFLPYWLLLPNKKPAEAAHCRVDDAELVGSWYEGLTFAMRMLGDPETGEDVRQGLRRHLMKSWGEHGLRYSEPYPWTHTIHASFHEMGYILPALNLIVEEYPDDEEAEKRASELVRGMRGLVIERKVRSFWSGDYPETEKLYEFPNDIYLADGGFDLTHHTGRGEQAIRNAVVVPALVRRWELTGDEVALDLAEGITNHVLGPSRYFSYDMHFFGHVHSAVWFASGIVKLGRLTGNETYIKKGKGIYDFVRSLSSDFGWVPEYARWHAPNEEHCETCCIKDMLVCAKELVDCGYAEYWGDLDRFARNQLMENQVRYTGYVVSDDTRPDENGITYRAIGDRMLGGFTGGSEPNSMSLSRFRSIAGCCVGTAPVALKTVYDASVTEENGALIVNIAFDRETPELSVRSFIPDEGKIAVTAKTHCRAGFRIYDWMKEPLFTVDGREAEGRTENGTVVFGLAAGQTLEITFPLGTEEVAEQVREEPYTVFWRGPDVVRLLPEGSHVRLYQRDKSIPKVLPKPEDVEYTGAVNYGPTQQKQ